MVSQVLVVGEARKHLSCLITLKCEVDENLQPVTKLSPSARAWCRRHGCDKNVPREEGGLTKKYIVACQALSCNQ